ncbi:chemotaxis protein CheB [Deinococcus malanensis]|uniref:protein-glutamate methylesterase n=1 Tax=Deinococcus malanensis TaxID=1706855 RepID=A0ABQ2ESB8_9DEIO|nr:chemotaxis protein CheB [Deinococcus malanensis]GGK19581.1 chemotaxis protein CheB [Deinococcus malanensis]
MLPHRLIVVGASAGGTQPLIDLATHLPADFPAAICIVTHIPAYTPSHLPEILNRAGPLPATHAQDGEPIRPGHIYCAPAEHHLLTEHGCLLVRKGPKENRARPAVDVLFRSAAYSEGPNAIGVVLSDMLDDGTSGLWSIKHFGGTTVVQDPKDAEHDSMPQSALTRVEVDHVVRVADLAALLDRLARNVPRQAAAVDDATRERTRREVRIARSDNAFRQGVMEFGKVTPQTCPECGGVLVQISESGFTRYRCHTGHAYTGDTLLVSVTEHIEETLWATCALWKKA